MAGLEALQRLASEAGAEDVAAEAAALRERLAEGRFYVACLGQFKRGKSTLLNALVGESVLPVGVVPVTSALTILRHGAERTARVIFGDGGSRMVGLHDVAAYVAEEHNPENAKDVAAVEITLPSPLLASGTCLVDTPGVGSVFAGNTAVTREFLPHVDAAIVVLGADPPISGEERRDDRGRRAGDARDPGRAQQGGFDSPPRSSPRRARSRRASSPGASAARSRSSR